MTVKEELHQLVETMPETQLPAARQFLRYLHDMGMDPLLRTLAGAPVDDEPETAEEAEAVKNAKADIAAGRTVSHEEFLRETGL